MSKPRNDGIHSAAIIVALTFGVIALAPRGIEPVRTPAVAPSCVACAELTDLRRDLERVIRSSSVKKRAKKQELELAEAFILRQAGIRIGRFFRTDDGKFRDATDEEARAGAEFFALTLDRDSVNIVLETVAETLGPATGKALARLETEIGVLKDSSVLTEKQASAAMLSIEVFGAGAEE